MELLRQIEFTEALSLLQGVIGWDVQVVVNLPGNLFDCDFNGRLERVETLNADGTVLMVFDREQGIALDPAELESFVGCWPGQSEHWLEFHIAWCRACVQIEPLESFADEGPVVGLNPL